MKTAISKVVLAVSALALSASASAVDLFGSDLKIDTGNPVLGTGCGACLVDPDSVTGIFDELGFAQFLATSVYDLNDNSILGAFFDTNDQATLTALGIPGTYPNILNTGNVSLVQPLVPAQVNIDALSPLVPPIPGTDNEGYLNNWELLATYTLEGDLQPTGPTYTGGTIDFYMRDYLAATDTLVLSFELTGSNLQLANLQLDFDVTYAKPGFWLIDLGAGFVDLSASLAGVTAQLDTNVNPPFPTPEQLADVFVDEDHVAIRQTTLDGSIGIRAVPAPGSLMLLGLGLLGLVSARKKKFA